MLPINSLIYLRGYEIAMFFAAVLPLQEPEPTQGVVKMKYGNGSVSRRQPLRKCPSCPLLKLTEKRINKRQYYGIVAGLFTVQGDGSHIDTQ